LLPILHTDSLPVENGSMSAEPKKLRSPEPRRQVGRVIRRLLTAVDRSIAAADEAREARDQLARLAAERKGKHHAR